MKKRAPTVTIFIRHVDREQAKEYAKGIKFDDSFLMDYEQWKLERAKKRERELKQLESEGK